MPFSFAVLRNAGSSHLYYRLSGEVLPSNAVLVYAENNQVGVFHSAWTSDLPSFIARMRIDIAIKNDIPLKRDDVIDLVRGWDHSGPDESALHWVIYTSPDRLDLIEALIEAGDDVDARGDGYTVLDHYLIHKGLVKPDKNLDDWMRAIYPSKDGTEDPVISLLRSHGAMTQYEIYPDQRLI